MVVDALLLLHYPEQYPWAGPFLRTLLTLNCVALVAQLVDYYNMLFDRKRSEHRSSWIVPSTPG